MTGDENRDVTGRLAELEATVRGLTQELVSCEERIRQLESALEASAGAATKDTRGEPQPDAEAAPEEAEEGSGDDVEDIIVA